MIQATIALAVRATCKVVCFATPYLAERTSNWYLKWEYKPHVQAQETSLRRKLKMQRSMALAPKLKLQT